MLPGHGLALGSGDHAVDRIQYTTVPQPSIILCCSWRNAETSMLRVVSVSSVGKGLKGALETGVIPGKLYYSYGYKNTVGECMHK